MYQLQGYGFVRSNALRDPICANNKNTGNTFLSVKVGYIPSPDTYHTTQLQKHQPLRQQKKQNYITSNYK